MHEREGLGRANQARIQQIKVQPRSEKYSDFPKRQITSIIHAIHPKEGRIAIVTDAGLDAVDAGGAADESATCGRRSRVVLTPRRWRQVCEGSFAGDGDNKARSPRRARRKPLIPLRREGRVSRRTCGSTPVLFVAQGAAGAPSTRLSLRPLFSGGQCSTHSSGTFVLREGGGV